VPHLKDVIDELADDPVVFISITDEDPDLIKKFLSKRPMPGWVGVDTDRSVFDSYGVTGRPKVVVVDPNGMIALVTVTHELDAEILRAIATGDYAENSSQSTVATSSSGSKLPHIGGFSPGLDPYLMPWVMAGEIESTGYQSTLRPSCVKEPVGYGHAWRDGGVGISAIGQTPAELIVLAYHMRSSYRVIDESKLSAEKRYDLIYSRPKALSSSLDQAWEDVGKIISEFFQIVVTPVKEERRVWVATLEKDSLESYDDWDWENDPAVKTLKPVDMFLQRYEAQTGNIVVMDMNFTTAAFLAICYSSSRWKSLISLEVLLLFREKLIFQLEATIL